MFDEHLYILFRPVFGTDDGARGDFLIEKRVTRELSRAKVHL